VWVKDGSVLKEKRTVKRKMKVKEVYHPSDKKAGGGETTIPLKITCFHGGETPDRAHLQKGPRVEQGGKVGPGRKETGK